MRERSIDWLPPVHIGPRVICAWMAEHVHPDWGPNPCMCPDWESNLQPFSNGTTLQPTESHRTGLLIQFLRRYPNIKFHVEMKSFGKMPATASLRIVMCTGKEPFTGAASSHRGLMGRHWVQTQRSRTEVSPSQVVQHLPRVMGPAAHISKPMWKPPRVFLRSGPEGRGCLMIRFLHPPPL